MQDVARVANSTLRREKRRGLVLFQMLFVAGFLALMWFSFGQNVLAPRKELGAPERLGTLGLVSGTEGQEALAQISKMHGTYINLVTAYIAEYAHADERLTVWVGTAENAEAAAELTGKMVSGIQKGGSGFVNLQRMSISGHDVFQVDGPGGKHFFYHSSVQSERVVWLAVEKVDILPLLEEAVKTF